ncbi:hypothetical protein NMG60_11017680 [Bertholletia excelsa]
MKEHRESQTWCYFHPKEEITGVCALCLKQRLLVLAKKQGHLPQCAQVTYRKHKKPPITFPSTTSALASVLNRFESRQKQFGYSDNASSSPEDSFISIKIEENGVASWEKGTVTKVSLDHCNISWSHGLGKESKESKSVVERGKQQGSLRWQKRIGQLFQLARWKRSSKGSVCHVSKRKTEGVKVVRRGWIRSMTKRRAKEERVAQK